MFSTRDPLGNLFEGAAEAGLAWKERSIQRREQKEFDTRVRVAYEKALAQAKVTGDMPLEHQQLMGSDVVLSQLGVKAVALRELKKKAPEHPLVISQTCRDQIAKQTRINFNLANRPDVDTVNLHDYVPNDQVSSQIIENSKNKP